ncbi:MAG: aspartate aminotransferase family protein [Pseudomonadales bacterium]|nr:aspartate aminotransferase family protein [Pseudomonadales bacterium]
MHQPILQSQSLPSDPWPFLPGRFSLRVVRAQGSTLWTDRGEALLDAAGGAIVNNIGHGRRRVADALADATATLTYAVPPWSTPSREALAERLRAHWLPSKLDRVYFSSGGSESTEVAMKLAIQHFQARGEPARTKILGRSLSYHGTTISTTAVGGHDGRKAGLGPLLQSFPQLETPYPLRCPAGLDPAAQLAYYLADFDRVVAEEGAHTLAALMAEPIVGSSGGALTPPPGYWPAIAERCRQHGMLLIFDEVMTGFGRTGRAFAGDHWGVVPDILVGGKGLAGGYAPLGGVFSHRGVLDPIADAGLEVMFHTFGAHPGACAAACEVLAILEEEALVAAAAEKGQRLKAYLDAAFGDHPHVAEIRAAGLLLAVELVEDRSTGIPFPKASRLTLGVLEEGLKRGVYYYPGGTGTVRDILCLGPAMTTTDAELERMALTLREAVDAAVMAAQGRP